jgi:glyoxalase family protein
VRNLTFYRDLLVLRFVKKTVNFDDPFTYHFYFGDELGSPGTILTFFPWPGARPGRTGAGIVETVCFAVPAGALDFWRDRLARAGVAVTERARVFGETGISFSDPDGMQLGLVEANDAPATHPWATEGVPMASAIRSFHSAVARVRDPASVARFLGGTLGFTLIGEEDGRSRFRTGETGIGVYDVIADPGAPPAQSGRGTVHHVAWMTADAAANERWRERLLVAGGQVSPLMDRNYFRSIYFREPGGVLFEFATKGPGFAIDEPAASLGTTLRLPAQYEEHRKKIEAALPKLP